MTTGPALWADQIDPILRRHRWVVCSDAAAAATEQLRRWAEIGVARPFLVCATPGTGEQPDAELAEVVILHTGGDTIMDGFRRFAAALADPPAGLTERLDAWDPQRRARVLPQFADATFRLAGRRPYGTRRPDWAALEDKTIADDLWDAAGVPRAPADVVAAEPEALAAAHRRLDEGAGTVWVADNAEGWHGGAEYVRRVAEPDAATVGFFGAHARRVRVMPYLEGIPCSIHAMVFPGTILTFRPVEMLVFPHGGRFRYAGLSSAWDPPAHRRAEMGDVARRVAAHLGDTLGYRGAFSIDGVMTAAGFRPTELNPRFSPGLAIQGAAVDGLPLGWINRALIEGEDLDYRPEALGDLVLEAADATRTLRALIPVAVRAEATVEVPVAVRGDRVVPAPGEPHGMLRFGPAAQGGLVMFTLDPAHIPTGPSAAPLVRSAFALADETWGTGISL